MSKDANDDDDARRDEVLRRMLTTPKPTLSPKRSSDVEDTRADRRREFTSSSGQPASKRIVRAKP